MELEHIVVATDLTSRSSSVYAQALRLAREVAAKVSLVHADGTIRWQLPGLSSVKRYIDQRQGVTLERIEAHRDTLRQLGVETEAIIVSAHTPWRAILDTAAELGADLLVVGRGHAHAGRLGSTAKRLARHAELPLLVCEETERPQIDELPAFERLFAATDLSDIANLGVRASFDLAQSLRAQLTVVHVVPPFAHLSDYQESLMDHGALRELEASLRASGGARLATLVAELDPSVTPRVVVGASLTSALDQLAYDEGDLLTITSHGASEIEAILLGSAAERVLEAARVPVLLLRRQYLAMWYQSGPDDA